MHRAVQRLLKKNLPVLLFVIILFALVSLKFKSGTVQDKSHRTMTELYKQLEYAEPLFKVVSKTTPQPEPEAVHVSFLKVHKSGSTTAQNIFLRFGWQRNLTFLLAPAKNNAFVYPNIISLRESLTKNNTLPPPPGKHFDTLCHHVLYDHDVFRRFLPNDTVYIGIVREPFEQFKSTLNYLRPAYIFKRKVTGLPASSYLKNPRLYEPKMSPLQSYTNNRMALEFGFPPDIIRSGNRERALDYIKLLDADFRLVIVAEYFEESVLLMRRLLNWSTKDVLYLDKNIAVKKNETALVGPYDRQLYKKWAKIDYALYEHFYRKLRDQIRSEGFDFDDELLHFKEIRKMVEEFCRQQPFEKDSKLVVSDSKWSPGFEVTLQDCLQLRRGEISFTQSIRQRQYGSKDI